MKIIALQGKSNMGKSTALGRLVMDLCDRGAKLLEVKKDFEENVSDKVEEERKRCFGGENVEVKDFAAILDYRGKKIGVVTQGDTRKCMDYWFDDFILVQGCDVVVCACRTKGETIEKLEEIKAERLIFVSKAWIETAAGKYDDFTILDRLTDDQIRLLIEIIDREIA